MASKQKGGKMEEDIRPLPNYPMGRGMDDNMIIIDSMLHLHRSED